MQSLTAIDLFAGAGGLTEGLREVGFMSVYANEIQPTYVETFRRNHPSGLTDARDIRAVDAADIRAQVGMRRGELTLLAGGPPCQGFSINAPERREDDHRNHLFREYLRFVEEFMPASVLIENVPGLVSFSGGSTLEAILTSLDRIGYSADVQILYAPHYGVPQTRWRTVVIGMRDGQDPSGAFPNPLHSAPLRVNFTSSFGERNIVALPRKDATLKLHTTVRDAIDDLPILANGEEGESVKPYRTPPRNWYQEALRVGSDGVRNHGAVRLSALNMTRLAHIPPGGNWTDIPFELLPAGMQRARNTDHTKRYGRADPDGLSSTILTKCDPHWGAYFHYAQDRAFTVREAARIQSFPDTYVFTGSKVAQFEQVGNAVPPMLARAVGLSVMRALGIAAEDAPAAAS